MTIKHPRPATQNRKYFDSRIHVLLRFRKYLIATSEVIQSCCKSVMEIYFDELPISKLKAGKHERLYPKTKFFDRYRSYQYEVIDGFTMRQYTAALFFEIEKAFDRISRVLNLQTMQKLGTNDDLLIFAAAFLEDIKFNVRIGNKLSTAKHQKIETSHGSVFSPIRFILALNDTGTAIKRQTNYSLFADNVVIYLRGESIIEIQHTLESTINELENWANYK